MDDEVDRSSEAPPRWQTTWLYVGGRAPSNLRIAAYLITAILCLVAANLLGAGGLAALSIVGGWLGVAVLEWFWGLRHRDT